MSINLTENALTVLKTRYLLEGEQPEDLFRRVAVAVASAEKTKADQTDWSEKFYAMMEECKFMPNSPTLFNAGTGQGTLSACFVIPVNDTMESIMQAATTSAMIQKYGGGIGYSFSKLRSRGRGISTTHGKACGSVSVLKMLSSLSDMITQGGKRHGANMGILHIEHPEIMDFIHMKDDNSTAQNFNVSVALTDKFMQALEGDQNWDLIDPHTQEVMHTLPARTIWEEIIDSAWKTGDPGLYFIDEANRSNPTPHLGNLDSTNPCGEVPLLAHEACNLGSINLGKLVKSTGTFDFDQLTELTAICTRFLDNVVTINQFPREEVAKAVAATRKIGLGIMGWHDALIQMGVPYDSPQALELADTVMGTINKVSRQISMELAEERGPYPACKEDTPIRNATRTCIAPTGSISAIATCSSGIEPLFALAFVKNVLDGKQLKEINPYFIEVAQARGFYSEDLMDQISETGSCQDIDEVPDDVKALFKTAMEIPCDVHVSMQAVFQKHTDLAVSKTINLPNEASRDDIESAYKQAYNNKCKGITVYRDGCKPTQVLETGKQKEKISEENVTDASHSAPRERPRTIEGRTERVRTGHGNLYVTINYDETGDPFELFTTLGKSGGCDAANLEAISRLISLALRSGIEPVQISDQLKNITCHPAWDQGVLVHSAPDAVSKILERHMTGESSTSQSDTKKTYGAQMGLWSAPKTNGQSKVGGSSSTKATSTILDYSPKCPECESPAIMQEGCISCTSCGWNKCG